MVEKSYKSEGVVLKSINFGEADKIFTVFSQKYGKITLLAKGIRRLSSRKKGNLEVFNHIIFFARKTRSLDLVTEVQLLESFPNLRKKIKKIAVAYEFFESVDKLTAENLSQSEVYYLLLDFLRNLEIIPDNQTEKILEESIQKLLKFLGFWPKEKPFPSNKNAVSFVEEIIEKELKSKKFLKKIS